MSGPPSNGRDVEEDVLTGLKGPRSGQVEGDSQGVTRQSLDGRPGGLSAAVSVEQTDQACASLQKVSQCVNSEMRMVDGEHTSITQKATATFR